MCGVHVPLHSAEHFYVVTEQIEGVHRDLPILRDPDGYTYIREEVGGLLVGGFEPEAKPWVAPDRMPYPFEFQLLDEDWDHFSILMDSAIARVPALATTGIKKFYNGPESFTPDNQFLLGESPEVKNFFVGAGFNSVGIASAGGAGRALAEWIVEGEPTSDLSGVDIRRFAPFNSNNQWLHDRVGEVLGLHYAVPWPNRELDHGPAVSSLPGLPPAGRGRSLLRIQDGMGAGQRVRPDGTKPVDRVRLGQAQLAAVVGGRAARHPERGRPVRPDVLREDSGPRAGRRRLLQWLCSADVAVEPGRAVYTGDAQLAGRLRVGSHRHPARPRRVPPGHVVGLGGAGPDWISRHTAPGDHVDVVDVSSAYAVYGVMGPRSRQLCCPACRRSDFSNQAFPFGTSRDIDLGYSTVRATRITYVGELGWELYVPAEFAVGVYELLASAGRDLGLVDAGYYSINSLRLEKGYRAWGSDLTPDYTPVEAGLVLTCKLKTDIDFRRAAAVEKVRAEGPRRRLVSLVVDDPEPMLWGGEMVVRDGDAVGQVTSAAWGATLGSCVALAYMWRPDGGPVTADFLTSGDYQVDVGRDPLSGRGPPRAPYDPANERVRS